MTRLPLADFPAAVKAQATRAWHSIPHEYDGEALRVVETRLGVLSVVEVLPHALRCTRHGCVFMPWRGCWGCASLRALTEGRP